MVAFATILSLSLLQVSACGLRLEKPHAHFDGTDEQGHVLFVDSLGDLDLGDGLNFPIFAMFNSGWRGSSPYLGQGWMLPLLESKIVQIDDNTFQLWQPDGWYQFMSRDTTDNTILNGQGGWKAEISGNNTITAWAPCGWKLVFNEGKIVSIVTPKNRNLEIVYRGGKAAEVDLDGTPVLGVGTDSNGEVNSLQFNKGTLSIEQANKPQLEVLNGKTVVGSVSPSLSKMTFPDGRTDQFHFNVDSKLEPRMTFGSSASTSRTFGWDSSTDLITQDNDWTYKVTPSSNGQTAAFSRSTTSGQAESWFNDPATGQEVTEVNGVKRIASRFASGKLSGLMRKITETVGGQETTVYAADYDEQGRQIRVMDKGKLRTIVYNDANNSESVYVDSKLLLTATFDDQHRLISSVATNGYRRVLSYLPDGTSKETDTFPDGRIVSR
jgi:hypothetical protein